jgi:hypothetical protein
VDPQACVNVGGSCIRDVDCCSHNRCLAGRCSSYSVTAASKALACSKKCAVGDASCEEQRRRDCAYAEGVRAASLGVVVQGA